KIPVKSMQNFLSLLSDTTTLSLSIGKFDGVHVAHQHLLQALGPQSAVLVVDKTNLKEALTPLDYRQHLLKKWVDQVYFLALEEAFLLEPPEFVRLIESKFSCLQKIVVGYDFRFGHKRMGNVDTLKTLLNPKITLEVIPEIKIKGISLHAYHIKECIKKGDISLACQFLGHPFMLEGPIISGQGLGHQKLYPTLNMAINPEMLLPSFGVYATHVKFLESYLPSVSFLGNRLSTDGKIALETHILNTSLSTPPPSMRVFFVQKIRDNALFDNLNSLKHQISLDLQEAKHILKA
ncbi:bifunctional riboflavin kinase/FAD synthetase, partial [Helicobacter suis]|uniref:bifunctional riboflavin kinase/FAD synthetase n=1 Tax=Helicobacter suis TaxID=104628 RepID=UPI002492B5C5